MMTSVSGFQPADSTDSPAIPAVAVDRRADAVVLTVTGEVDMTTAPEFEHAVRDALAERPATLVIDLTGAEFFSSAGIAVLVLAHRNDAGVALRVVATDRIVLRPLELTGLSERPRHLSDARRRARRMRPSDRPPFHWEGLARPETLTEVRRAIKIWGTQRRSRRRTGLLGHARQLRGHGQRRRPRLPRRGARPRRDQHRRHRRHAQRDRHRPRPLAQADHRRVRRARSAADRSHGRRAHPDPQRQGHHRPDDLADPAPHPAESPARRDRRRRRGRRRTGCAASKPSPTPRWPGSTPR